MTPEIKSGSKIGLIIGGVVVGLAVIGLVVWAIWRNPVTPTTEDTTTDATVTEETTTTATVTEETTTPVVDPTADWKTYTNDRLNISVKYPNGWKVEEESGEFLYGAPVLFIPPNVKPFERPVVITFDGRFSTLSEVRDFYKQSENQDYTYSEESMTIDSEQAYVFTRSDQPNTKQIFVFRGGDTFSVEASYGAYDEVSLIIDSLQFTD